MKVTRNTVIFAASLAAGLALGFVGGPAIILLPWALVALAIGILSVGRKMAAVNGLVFGFVAAFTFMLAGYDGQAAIITRVFPFGVLGLVGALYAVVFSVVGNVVYRRIQREK
jgi:hypothetical protein